MRIQIHDKLSTSHGDGGPAKFKRPLSSLASGLSWPVSARELVDNVDRSTTGSKQSLSGDAISSREQRLIQGLFRVTLPCYI